MKKLCLVIFGLSFILRAEAQNLNQYQYVQVPEAYEFLSEKNKYQLNELTAFLLEKYGFEVFYKEELPENVDVCEVLKADVEKDNGIFRTKVKLSLKDCKGETVFVSKMGMSREKNFKDAYHEALRDAFSSLEGLDYSYSPSPGSERNIHSEVVETPAAETAAMSPEEVDEVVAEEPVTEKLVAEKALPEVVDKEEVNDAVDLRNGTALYTLERTASGYVLKKKNSKEKFATLLKSGGGSNYIFSSKSFQGNAYFDADKDLVVEYIDTNTGLLSTLRFSRD